MRSRKRTKMLTVSRLIDWVV